MLLLTPIGKFYPNKNFGSKIKSSLLPPVNEYAAAYAREALDRIDGVFVKSAQYKKPILTVNLIINDEERQVSIDLENYL